MTHHRLPLVLVGFMCIALGLVATAQAAGVKIVELAISGGKLASAHEVVRVTEGDRVELRWTSDAPLELHLHGYDKTLHVGPGAPGIMAFEAHATGRYPVTIHGPAGGGHSHDHATLLYLEVHPR